VFGVVDVVSDSGVVSPRTVFTLFVLLFGVPLWIFRHAILYNFCRVFLRNVLFLFFKDIQVLSESNLPTSVMKE
jgi:hypothetical protein